MTLETIVNNMISANEPESNIAMVIKAFKKAKGLKKETSPLKQHILGHQDPTDPDEDDAIRRRKKEQEKIENPVLAEKKKRFEMGKFTLDEKEQYKEFRETGAITAITPTKKEKEPVRKDEWQQLTKEQEGEIYKKYGVANLMPDGTLYPTGTGPVWDQRAEQAAAEIQEANNQVLKQDLINNSDGFAQKLLTKYGLSLSEEDGDIVSGLGKGILNIVSSADGMAFIRANNTIQKFNERVEKQGLKDDDIIEYGGFDETQGSGKTLEGFIRKKIDPPTKGTVAEARKYYNEKFIEPLIASKKYQQLISSLGNVEILDGKGNITDEAQQIAGEQLPQVLGAMFFGIPTLYQEAAGSAMEIINQGIISQIGEEEFNKLSEEEIAAKGLDLLNNGDINLEPAIENGMKSAALDSAGSFLVVGQATKFIPKKFLRQVISGNLNKQLLAQAGRSTLKGLGGVLGEEITEISQEGLGAAAVLKGTGVDLNANFISGLKTMRSDEITELMAQTLIGVSSIGGVGKSITTATTAAKDIILDIQANFDPNTTRAILNSAKRAKELQYIKGEITAKDYNEFLNELEAGEAFVNNTKLKKLSKDKKRKAFDAAVEFKKAEKTIEDTQSSIEQAKKDDNLSAIPDLEQDLKDSIELKKQANKKIIKEVALEARDTDGFNLRDWVNSQTEGVWADKKINTFDTVEQARKYIEKNYKKNLKDQEVINLLEGDVRNNAIKLGNEAIIVEENVLANLENDDVIGTNAIHHEVTHFILDQATATELNSLKKGVKKELSKSNDPKIKAVLEFAQSRRKQYAKKTNGNKGLTGKALNEEFFAAISDGLRGIEINELQNEEVSLLRGIGNMLQDTFGNLTNGELDFNKMNAVNTLQFIKKFNKFNSKDTKIKLNAPKVKGIDVDEVKASKPLTKEELAAEFSTLEKGKIPEQTAVQAAYAYEPLAQSIANRIYRDYPGFKESGFTKDDFAMQLTFGQGANSLLGLAKSYDPKVGSIGGYFDKFLPERAKAVMEKFIGKSATNAGTSLDATEARELEANEKINVEAKDAVEALAVPKNILDTVKDDKTIDLMVLSAENQIKKLPKTATNKQKITARKKGTESIIKKQIAPKLKQELLKTTKNKDDFKKYLDKNWESVGNAFLNNTDIGKIRNEETRELLEGFEDNGFTKEDIVNYFTDTSLAKNTLSDRKNVGLINTIVAEVTDQLRIEAAKKDPLTAADFKKSTGIPLASRPLSQIARQNAYLKANPNAPQTLPYNSIEKLIAANSGFKKVPVLDTPDKAREFVKSLKDLVFSLPVEIVTKIGFYNPSGRIFPNYDKNKKWINSKGNTTGRFKNNAARAKAAGYFLNKSEGRKKFEAIETAFNTERDALIKDLKKNSTVKLYGAAKGFTAYKFADLMGSTPAEILNNKDKILDQNVKAMAMHEQVWKPLYEFIKKDPKNNTAPVGFLLKNGSKTATHWHRVGIEMVGTSKKFEGGFTYEHAMPMVSAYLALIDSAAKNVPFNISYPAVQSNYKLLALSGKDDKKLKGPYKAGMGDGWNFYTGNWKERYFNPTIANSFGGIDPASIVDFNSESYAKKYNIDNKGFSTIQQAKDASITLASKPLSKEFNKMLERSKGVKEAATYSDGRAIKLGSTKGFKFFVPYSAEDFLGLIYPTLGKGKQGDADLNWWKESIMTPYNDGISSFEAAKQAAMLDWKNLKKSIQNTPSNLNSEATRGFTNQEAVRVYLWDKQGMPLEDLSKKDTKSLVSYVSKNPELKAFADQIQNLTEDGYPAPTENWLSGTITTDLVNHVNTVYRSQFLEPWQKNIEEVFDKDNLKKLQATFGDRYVEALEDSLYRMRTGRNRPSGVNRITNNWLNWVNDSVGSIMFFNARSAVLQTTSAINFLNWSDNNPARAAKAFANQKQYWKDFSELWNSDFLKQRRSGLKTDVNADEIANAVSTSKNKVRAGISYLLKKGFLPTQIADSFAISSGGATFYRNRIESYIKEGFSKEEAQKKAFADFRDSTNESQQSSDPSRISQEQASGLGRIILAFANTPIQYTRLTKRAVQDLANGRGDWKTNVSKIVYYGAVQNIIFTALQQAMFGLLFTDDDDEDIGPEEKKFRDGKRDSALAGLLNSSADTFLRGSGVGGAFVAMLKNIALEIKRQSEKTRPDYERAADKIFTVSPAIDSKFGKLKSAGRTFTFKDEVDKIYERGIAIDNPALSAAAKTISAFLNIPIDRVVKKLNNINTALDQETQLYQSIALMMGWGEWELGIQAKKKDELNIIKKEKKSEAKKVKTLQKNIDKLDKKNNPIKAALPAGTLGQANKDGTIDVADGLSPAKRKEVIAHEKRHQKEIKSGKLNYDNNFIYYGNKKYERKNGHIAHNGKWKSEGDGTLPWEKHANNHKSKTA